ncbi:MAG TPA: NtaA/DmoA family FMN-dependent monooxygenase [Actinomycetaceae bacterium]|nr:NtaA/DmoA family FMN-dependent monooxygenase [Actinomycetaceae bacterium]
MRTNEHPLVLIANLGSQPQETPWWEAGASYDITSLDDVIDYAAKAEAAGFDALFKADFIGFNPSLSGRAPVSPFEPLQLAAAIAARVPRIAMIPTVSVLFSQPYAVARSLSSLDWMLPGRLAWNLVTSFNGERNFGIDEIPEPATRYRQAAEFYDVIQALWRSWPPESRIANRETREYIDLAAVQPINHDGEFYRVEGPIDLPVRSAELPVLVQAGASADGIDSAVHQADVVFAAAPTIDQARELRERIRARAEAAGRDPDTLRVIFGAKIVAEATEEAAWERLNAPLTEAQLVSARLGIERELAGLTLEDVGLDDPLPVERFATFPIEELGRRRSRAELILDIAQRQPWTVRGFLTRAYSQGSHLNVVGSYDQVVDEMQHWHEQNIADGFIMIGDVDLDTLAEEVLGRLRRRGLLSDRSSGWSLRASLGLD